MIVTRILCPAILCFCMVLAPLVSAQAQVSSFAQWQQAHDALSADASVIAYYDFQQAEGATLPNRSKAGTALDGKIHGAQWVQGRWPGKGALEFDGADAVEIPAADALFTLDTENGGTGQMTIEVWLNATAVIEAGIVDKSSGGWGKDAPYMIWISPHQLCAIVGRQPNDAVTLVRDRVEVLPARWTHVVMTIDTESIALYQDGARVGQAPRAPNSSVTDNSKPLLFGAMGHPKPEVFHFHGLLDEVVLYDKALPESVIAARAALAPATGPPSLVLTSPRGGERWAAGSLHQITWAAANLPGRSNVRIELSNDDGKNWEEIVTVAPRTSKFPWRVPEAVGAACRIRISVEGIGLAARNKAPFTIMPSEKQPDYKWIKVALPTAFAPRDGAGALVYRGRMWLLGGWNPGDKKHFPRICNNEVWSSKDGVDWTLVKPNTFLDQDFDTASDWEGRHTAGYVVYKDKMWIVGGDANQGHYQFDVWNSTDGSTWTWVNKDNPVPWGPRVLHYTLVFKDKIWVIGGQTVPQFGRGEDSFYRDVWTTTDGINWTEVVPEEPFWPQRGMIGGNVVFNDRIWILGGGTYDTPSVPTRKLFNDVWSSADGANWTCHTEAAPWAPRQYHEVAVFDNRMWVLEGSSHGNRNDVWHSSDGSNWYELPDTPWKPRHAASVFVHDNALWMVAGNNMESDVWKLVRVERVERAER